MIKLKVKEIIDLFDTKKDDLRHDISSVINLVGEDLGASLFKQYYESTYKKTVTISPTNPVSGARKGPRLDRWIYVEDKLAFQTEIKNWSAYAIGARIVDRDESKHKQMAFENWKDRVKKLLVSEKNGESKVFFKMKIPTDIPIKAKIEPLIIYWFMLSKDGKSLDPYFTINIKNKNGFTRLHVFSMSNYLRTIKKSEIVLEMASAQKRISILDNYFPESLKVGL